MRQPNALDRLRYKYDIYEKEWCSDEDNEKYSKMVENDEELPENIFPAYFGNTYKLKDCNDFYELKDCGFSYEEKMEYLKYKQLNMLEEQTNKIDIIKKCAIFFVVLTAISLLITFISFSQLSNIL